MSRVADMEIGSTIICTRHNGPVLLSSRMKNTSCRVCDACMRAYKIAYNEARRNSARAEKVSAGKWLNRRPTPCKGIELSYKSIAYEARQPSGANCIEGQGTFYPAATSPTARLSRRRKPNSGQI